MARAAAALLAVGLIGVVLTRCGTEADPPSAAPCTAPTAAATDTGATAGPAATEVSGGGTSGLGDVNVVEGDGPGEPGGTLAYGLVADADGWNPTTARWSTSNLIAAFALFDTLAAYDEDLRWKPLLAESFTPDDDATTWRIGLRPDVRFHDGSPVDAAAVAAGLEYFRSSPLTGQPFELVASIEATGPLEVTVTMVEPWVSFPYAMTTQIGIVAPPGWLADGDPRQPVGSGAFRYTSWEPGRRLAVEANRDYWRPGLPLLDAIDFLPYPDETSRANALRSGELDAMVTSNGTQIARFKDLAAETCAFQVVNDPAAETAEVMVMLNTASPPLDDVRVRRALALATDAQAFIDALGDGQYLPADGPFSPGSRWYVPTGYPTFDLEAARRAVADLEAERGEPIAFTIVTVPETSATAGAQLLQSQWEAAGVDVEVTTMDQTALIASIVVGRYDATMWTQFDAPHPLADAVWWHPATVAPVGEIGLNFARNDDPAIGAALDEARRATDPAVEAAAYAEVSRLLAEDVPYLWLHHTQTSVVATSGVVDLVAWTLPDGSPGLELQGGAHRLSQTWLRR